MFSRSRSFFSRLMVIFVVTSACCTPYAVSKSAKKTGKITITGCLRQGRVAGRFSVKARDGKEYALRSASLKLGDYIGRTVSIKGRMQRDPGRDDYDFEGSEVNEEYGKKVLDLVDVDVEVLKVVRNSCE